MSGIYTKEINNFKNMNSFLFFFLPQNSVHLRISICESIYAIGSINISTLLIPLLERFIKLYRLELIVHSPADLRSNKFAFVAVYPHTLFSLFTTAYLLGHKYQIKGEESQCLYGLIITCDYRYDKYIPIQPNQLKLIQSTH